MGFGLWGCGALGCSLGVLGSPEASYAAFLGLPFRILNIDLVKPKKGTTMETIGSALLPFFVVYFPDSQSNLRKKAVPLTINPKTLNPKNL